MQLQQLRIRQQNLNHGEGANWDFMNDDLHEHVDLLTFQEPYLDVLGNTQALQKWRVVYPTTKFTDKSRVRLTILVNSTLNTNHWRQINFPSNDVTIIQFTGNYGRLTVINIYNDQEHQRTLEALRLFLNQEQLTIRMTEHNHVIWLGDFNRHHPLWEAEQNLHILCSQNGERYAEPLIELLADYDMAQVLPKQHHTYWHRVNHSTLTRPDNVFCTAATENLIEQCTVNYTTLGPGADHYPILTTVTLPMS
jgi:exonuclease III